MSDSAKDAERITVDIIDREIKALGLEIRQRKIMKCLVAAEAEIRAVQNANKPKKAARLQRWRDREVRRHDAVLIELAATIDEIYEAERQLARLLRGGVFEEEDDRASAAPVNIVDLLAGLRRD